MIISTLGHIPEIKSLILAHGRLVYKFRGVRCEIVYEDNHYYRYSYCQDSIKKRMVSCDYVSAVLRYRPSIEII